MNISTVSGASVLLVLSMLVLAGKSATVDPTVTCNPQTCRGECQTTSEGTRCVPSNPICLLPPVTGNCKANMPRYYYNSYARDCLLFIYGGCDGNANNFERKEDCLNACNV